MTTVDTSVWVLTIHKAYRRVPPSSISLAGETRESLARVTIPPCLPTFLALPLFLPILPLHLPSTRGTTKRNGVSTSAVAATPLPDAKPSVLPSGVVPGHQPAYVSTEQHYHGVNYNRGSASGRGPTGGGQRHSGLKKNDRDRNTLDTGNSLRVQLLGG